MACVNETDFKYPSLTLRNKFSLKSFLREAITVNEQRTQLYRNTPFGPWLDIGKIRGDPMLVHMFLQTEVIMENAGPEELYFKPYGEVFRFGRHEFCLITGLLFGEKPSIPTLPLEQSFVTRVFPGQSWDKLQLKVVVERMKLNCMRELGQEDAVRVCLVVMVELVCMGRELTTYVSDTVLRAVEDLVDFNSYPWGSYFWAHTFKQMHRAVIRRADTSNKLTMSGFIYPFKVWILELFPIARKLFTWHGDRSPRLFRWERTQYLSKLDCLSIFSSIGETGYNPSTRLLATPAEEQQAWYIDSRHYFQNVGARRPSKRARRSTRSPNGSNSPTGSQFDDQQTEERASNVDGQQEEERAPNIEEVNVEREATPAKEQQDWYIDSRHYFHNVGARPPFKRARGPTRSPNGSNSPIGSQSDDQQEEERAPNIDDQQEEERAPNVEGVNVETEATNSGHHDMLPSDQYQHRWDEMDRHNTEIKAIKDRLDYHDRIMSHFFNINISDGLPPQSPVGYDQTRAAPPTYSTSPTFVPQFFDPTRMPRSSFERPRPVYEMPSSSCVTPPAPTQEAWILDMFSIALNHFQRHMDRSPRGICWDRGTLGPSRMQCLEFFNSVANERLRPSSRLVPTSAEEQMDWHRELPGEVGSRPSNRARRPSDFPPGFSPSAGSSDGQDDEGNDPAQSRHHDMPTPDQYQDKWDQLDRLQTMIDDNSRRLDELEAFYRSFGAFQKEAWNHDPTISEVFDRTHCTSKKLVPGATGPSTDPPIYIDPRSEVAATSFVRTRDEEFADANPSTSTPEIEAQLWERMVGGPCKDRVYSFGNTPGFLAATGHPGASSSRVSDSARDSVVQLLREELSEERRKREEAEHVQKQQADQLARYDEEMRRLRDLTLQFEAFMSQHKMQNPPGPPS